MFSEQSGFQQISFPPFAPVLENSGRPLWSVMIPIYNPRLDYFEKAIRSVLLQGVGAKKMQIEVIDDASTEIDVEGLVSKWGEGRISYFRQTKNLGMVGSFNTCIERARGQWVHIFHQDDLLLPGFYGHLEAATRKPSMAGAAFCAHNFIDEHNRETFRQAPEQRSRGILSGWSERIAQSCRIQCCSIVVKRNTYESIGGFYPGARTAADWEMWNRIAAHFPVWYEPQLLASYRQHSSSMTSGLMNSANFIFDISEVIDIYRSYLQADVFERSAPKARKYYALYAKDIAVSARSKGKTEIAADFIKAALHCDSSVEEIRAMADALGLVIPDRQGA